jgi:hypothetical protein
MNVYNALLINVGVPNGNILNVYEKTSSHITINVAKPATETFILTPSNLTTGVYNTYNLNFYTNVVHPAPTFLLTIQFPTGV